MGFLRVDESPFRIPSFPREIGGGYWMIHLKPKGQRTGQRPNNDFIRQMKWGKRSAILSVPEDGLHLEVRGAAWSDLTLMGSITITPEQLPKTYD